MRPTVRKFLFGPLWRSMSFWVGVIFAVAAALNLSYIWRYVHRNALGEEQLLLLFAFLLSMGPYTFFSKLLPLRKQAQEETDEGKREIIGQ